MGVVATAFVGFAAAVAGGFAAGLAAGSAGAATTGATPGIGWPSTLPLGSCRNAGGPPGTMPSPVACAARAAGAWSASTCLARSCSRSSSFLLCVDRSCSRKLPWATRVLSSSRPRSPPTRIVTTTRTKGIFAALLRRLGTSRSVGALRAALAVPGVRSGTANVVAVVMRHGPSRPLEGEPTERGDWRRSRTRRPARNPVPATGVPAAIPRARTAGRRERRRWSARRARS